MKGLILLVADQVMILVFIADVQAVVVFGGGFAAIYVVDFFHKRKLGLDQPSMKLVGEEAPKTVDVRLDRKYNGVMYVICICDLTSPFPSHWEEIFWHGQLNSLAMPVCPPEEAVVRIKRHLKECVEAFCLNVPISATIIVNPVDEFQPVQPLSEQ
jgi:hypothetical protein